MADLKIITIGDIKAEKVKMLWQPYLPLGDKVSQCGSQDGQDGQVSAVTTLTILHGEKGAV
jgi:hypothetical protein